MIQVIIADDHPLVRAGLKNILAKKTDIKLMGEASDGNDLLNLLSKGLPDILILDMTMPGVSGLELLKDVDRRYPELPILILSIHPPERFAVRTLKAGAMGYLCKSSISEELISAIKKIVLQKRRYITGEVAEQLALQVDETEGVPLHETLSDREMEVLCLIASGKEVSEIAEELSLSTHTIHTYRSRIKTKMNLASNVEMTRYAIQNNLIE